jgi:hypothetical protein
VLESIRRILPVSIIPDFLQAAIAIFTKMRLLECGPNDGELAVTANLPDNENLEYAILSHTWESEEVTFEDLEKGRGKNKAGFKKIRFCVDHARSHGYQYCWVDTCCIDKSNQVELNEAIISMFRWYRKAARCYVYLSNVSITSSECRNGPAELPWERAFRDSRWFTWGWTLQELLAPASVEFFTRDGQRLGDKRSLEQLIHEITSIPISALRGNKVLSRFSIKERFKWARSRQTTREEDWIYCLLGVFAVSMPVLYGEGREYAIRRLRKEIHDSLNVDKLFSTDGVTFEFQAGSAISFTAAQIAAARQQINLLRQRGSATRYSTKFLDAALPLRANGWNDSALMASFYTGLKDDVKDILCMKDRPGTLEEYISMASAIDDRLYARRLEKKLGT